MAKQHGITTETYKRFILDAGAVYLNYGEVGEQLLGATRGGSTFTIETDYREMPVDGAKGPVKGGRRIVAVNATLTANFIEMSSEIMARVLPGSVTADYPDPGGKTHDEITRELEIALTDYATNVAIVAEVSGQNPQPVVLLVENALVDGNFELGLTEAEEPALTAAFKAHFDPADISKEPWKIRFPIVT